MKKILFVLSLALMSLVAQSQTKIGPKIYMYGVFNEKIGSDGPVAINFSGANEKLMLKIVDKFKDYGINAITYGALFIPGRTYSDTETLDIFKKKGIKEVINIYITDKNTSYTTHANSTLNGNTVNTTASNTQYQIKMGLKMDIHELKYSGQVSVSVVGEGSGNWGVLSSDFNVYYKVVCNILSALNKQNAFYKK
jgi:hypothetical protein